MEQEKNQIDLEKIQVDKAENINLEQLKTLFRFSLFAFLIAIVLAIILFFNIRYTDKLTKELDSEDSLINQLLYRDSILNLIMDVKYDSSSKSNVYSYREINGKVLTYNKILNELDKTKIENSTVNEKNYLIVKENNQNVEDYNALSKEYNKNIDDFNKIVGRLNDINTKHQELIKSNAVIKDSLQTLKVVYSLIKRNFNIDYKIEDKGDKITYSLKSDKLDSAMVLLKHFRGRLKKEGDHWIINTAGNK